MPGASSTTWRRGVSTPFPLSADNRALAIENFEHGGCKAAEVAAKLDTKTEYNTEDTNIVKIEGPQHLVRLKGGSKVEVRQVSHNYYNEGAAEIEAKTGEKYSLVTKQTTGVLTESGEEKEVRTTVFGYGGQNDLGWKLRAATSTTQEPSGLKLVHTTIYEASTGDVSETQSPEGTPRAPAYYGSYSQKGTAEGDLVSPSGIALDAKGDLYVTNDVSGDGIDEFTSKGAFVQRFGAEGTGLNETYYPEGITIANGLIYVADSGNNRIAVFNEKGKGEKDIGSKGTEGLKFSSPSGVAIDSKNDIWVSDYGNNRIQELNEKGEFIEAVGWGVSNGEAKFEICTTATTCKAGIAGSKEGEFEKPLDIAVAPNGNIYVTDSGNDRVEILNSKGEYQSKFGKSGSGNGKFGEPDAIAIAANGNAFVTDETNHRVEEFRSNNEFITAFGSKGTEGGEFELDSGIALNPNGNAYVVDKGNSIDQIEDWTIEAVAAGAHNIKAVYYSSAANSEFPACGEHPEWSGLTCETMPASQPGTAGLPELPVTLTEYTIWDAPETITETVGTVKRTKKQTVDAAGRVTSSEISSTIDTALPKTSNEYNEKPARSKSRALQPAQRPRRSPTSRTRSARRSNTSTPKAT
ncbi:MAG TPA: 6-bladed beta-propeller [Solirubrobacteraceae bacterium]|nr:6-bladed beta-propeller [Solirubrobacteraceae bacterium]